MKSENNIGWCDETINAVTGCDKVSAGCKNCYAQVGTRARVLRSQGIETWGAKGQRFPVNFKPTFRRLNKMLICDKCHNADHTDKLSGGKGDKNSFCAYCQARGSFRRIRLFADSNSDWLDEKWPIDTLAEFLISIISAENVDVQLLTKRPENFLKQLSQVIDAWTHLPDFNAEKRDKIQAWIDGNPPKNVWVGVSVEDNENRIRIGQLKDIPCAVRFISFEPLLEKLPSLRLDGITWAIVGAESGKNRRDCGIEPIINVTKQCVAFGVPVYVKQDCAFKSGVQGRIPNEIWSLKQFPKL